MEKINGLGAFEGTCNLLKFKYVEWERIGIYIWSLPTNKLIQSTTNKLNIHMI